MEHDSQVSSGELQESLILMTVQQGLQRRQHFRTDHTPGGWYDTMCSSAHIYFTLLCRNDFSGGHISRSSSPTRRSVLEFANVTLCKVLCYVPSPESASLAATPVTLCHPGGAFLVDPFATLR
mmetsp:Transcript_123494/g.214169  ORF Transcript_123494/g.214169 Transcript_123494/m.214169 type:complete len:123 (-) Transcript_123494:560-928(-)